MQSRDGSYYDGMALGMRLPPLPERRSGSMRIRHEEIKTSVSYFGRDLPYQHTLDVLVDDADDTIWMSASPQELRAYLPDAHQVPTGGRVLMSGLGVGLLPRLLVDEGRTDFSMIVIERNKDVIDLVWPLIERSGLRVIHGDVLEVLQAPPYDLGRFQLISMDTWPSGDYLYLPWIERVKAAAEPFLAWGGHLSLWQYEEVKRHLDNELRMLVPQFLDMTAERWGEVHVGLKEQWPYFYPFLKWVASQSSNGTVGSKAALRLSIAIDHRIRREVEAFQRGDRDGLLHDTNTGGVE